MAERTTQKTRTVVVWDGFLDLTTGQVNALCIFYALPYQDRNCPLPAQRKVVFDYLEKDEDGATLVDAMAWRIANRMGSKWRVGDYDAIEREERGRGELLGQQPPPCVSPKAVTDTPPDGHGDGASGSGTGTGNGEWAPWN